MVAIADTANEGELWLFKKKSPKSLVVSVADG